MEQVTAAIDFMEARLDEKLDLAAVARAAGYSKYHLHRMFAAATGLTVHDYLQRRRLTEAARLLAFSRRPIIDIALGAGYESQQAFTAIFRAMYKQPPGAYRAGGEFYPLQLRFTLQSGICRARLSPAAIRFAETRDIPAWMALLRLVVDGYPRLNEAAYRQKLRGCIRGRQALICMAADTAVGAMTFCRRTGSVTFLGVHPQYRGSALQKLFFDKLAAELPPQRPISITTYRRGDKADTGYRDELKRLGFAEQELLVEFGYPTQRFVLRPAQRQTE